MIQRQLMCALPGGIELIKVTGNDKADPILQVHYHDPGYGRQFAALCWSDRSAFSPREHLNRQWAIVRRVAPAHVDYIAAMAACMGIPPETTED